MLTISKKGHTTSQTLPSQFELHPGFVEAYRTNGTIESRAHVGGRSATLSSEQWQTVAQLVEATHDGTLEELSDQLEQRLGVRGSRATMSRMLQHLNLSRKNSAGN